jgi:hypothetical protein
MKNVLDNIYRENQNTRFMSNNFLRKSCRLWDNLVKFGRNRQAGHRRQYNMANALCMLRLQTDRQTDTHTHTHTHLHTHTYTQRDSEKIIIIAFDGKDGYAKAPPYYIYTYIVCRVKLYLKLLL